MRGAQAGFVDFQAFVGIIPADAGSTGLIIHIARVTKVISMRIIPADAGSTL